MGIVDTFVDYACKLADNENVVEIYKELEKIMEDASLYLEQAGILSCLYMENRDINLWLKMGMIIKERCNNKSFALKIFSTFLKMASPDFYIHFKEILQFFNFKLEEIEIIDINDISSLELEQLVNRYNAILYMMVFLNQRKEYAGILELAPYLKNIEIKTDKYLKTKNPKDKSSIDNMEDSKKHLSSLISKVRYINELNEFAIKLDNKNEEAYINIIYNLAFDNQEQKVQDFYRDEYLPIFKNKNIRNIVDVYWFLSDKFYEKKMFYESVVCQQKAIDKELAKM